MKNRFFAAITLIILFLPLVGFSENSLSRIETSPLDDREYASLVLDNGLKVIVVSDKDAPTAGAALVVKAGLYQDPATFPGLAHFLEHMLFLGTQKFPVPDEFQNFIQAYGGERNAMTQGDKTTFYFSIQPEAFDPALERFADFFVAPALYPEYVERELNAVEQEFHLYLHKDNWAAFEVSKETCNPQHPYHHYFGGNRETLGHDKKKLVTALNTFFKQHYHANNMTLALVGPQSTENLLAYAKKHFGSIAKTPENYKKEIYPALYTKKELGTDVYMKAKGETQELAIIFPLSYEKNIEKRKSKRIIASVLGYEGKGSLAAALKEKKWIINLGAAYEALTDEQDAMVLSFSLTDEGMGHIDDITRQSFQAIELLRKKGIPEYFIDEIKTMSQTNFTYLEKQEASGLALALANNLQVVPVESVLTSEFFLAKDKVSFEAVSEALSKLTPHNMRRMIVGPQVEGDTKSKWYQAEFRVEKNDDNKLQKLAKPYYFSRLALPEKNKYIPTDLKIENASSQQNEPQKIREGDLTLWHYQDGHFKQPKGLIFVNFCLPSIAASAENSVVAKIYSRMLLEALNNEYYGASLGGASISFHEHTRGITLTLAGYSDKQDVLLKAVLNSIKKFRVKESDFNAVREVMLRRLRDFDQHTLYEKAQIELNSLLISSMWHPTELQVATESLTLEKVKEFQKTFWQSPQVEMLVHGNVTQLQAEGLADSVQNAVMPKKAEHQPRVGTKMAKLPKGTKYYRSISAVKDNHAVVWYLQNEGQDDETLAKTLMLSNLLEVPFYQTLRVEKQLAYNLASQPQIFKKMSGFIFSIQSTQADPNRLLAEIRSFLTNFNKALPNMNQEEYAIAREALIQRLVQAPQTTEEQAFQWWGVIEEGENDFHHNETLAKALASVELKDLAAFANTVLDPHRQPAQLMVLSAPHSTGTEIASIKVFKEATPFLG